MVNYRNGKMYRVVCNITGKQYVGSTTTPLSKRLGSHVSQYKNNGTYYSVFEVLENGNYEIILIEEYPCDTKEQLLRRERYWVDELDCVNKLSPIYLEGEGEEYKKKYNEEHKEDIKEYMTTYYITNADELKARARDYRKNNLEEIKKQQAIYRAKNREKIKEQRKRYYQENKEKILERNKIWKEKNKK